MPFVKLDFIAERMVYSLVRDDGQVFMASERNLDDAGLPFSARGAMDYAILRGWEDFNRPVNGRPFGVDPFAPQHAPVHAFEQGLREGRINGVPLPKPHQQIEIDPAFNCPEYWERLLYNVREIYEASCCVAGGAVRDHLLGVAPKDIDIFVSYTEEDIVDKGNELGWGDPHFVANPEDRAQYFRRNRINPKFQEGVKEVLELRPESSDVPVQLIFRKYETVNDLLSTFDLNICQSAYSDYGILDTEFAKDDRDGMKITYRGDGDKEKSFVRAQRIQAHLGGDYKLVGFTDMADLLEIKKQAQKQTQTKLQQMMAQFGKPTAW